MAVDWYGPEMEARVRRGAVRGLGVAIGIVEKRAVSLILDTSKTGRLYRRRGVVHQASAPFEPFANDTGRTLASRRIMVDAAALRAALIFFGDNAQRLEHGTRKMKPRPYARRALAETAQQCQDAFIGEIITELRKP